jgi:hypothetical protein
VEIFTTAGIAPAATSVKESGWVTILATGAGDFAPLTELEKPNTDRGGSPPQAHASDQGTGQYPQIMTPSGTVMENLFIGATRLVVIAHRIIGRGLIDRAANSRARGAPHEIKSANGAPCGHRILLFGPPHFLCAEVDARAPSTSLTRWIVATLKKLSRLYCTVAIEQILEFLRTVFFTHSYVALRLPAFPSGWLE